MVTGIVFAVIYGMQMGEDAVGGGEGMPWPKLPRISIEIPRTGLACELRHLCTVDTERDAMCAERESIINWGLGLVMDKKQSGYTHTHTHAGAHS